MRNLVKMSDLSNEEVYGLIQRALELKAGASPIQRPDLIAANLFFENSTRTKHSFEVAQMKLGLQVRHSQEAYYQELEGLTIPVISGGDGSGEHPSQCLLDLMTLYEEFGHIEGLELVIAGDIKNSRVARSNYHMLTRLGAKVQFVGPQVFADPTLGQMVDFDQVIGHVDACMLLRVQFERHQEQVALSQADYHARYGLTPARYRALKPQAIVMHPAPVNRDMEIASELVEAPQSRIFTQMTNGRYMRQAILEKTIADNAL